MKKSGFTLTEVLVALGIVGIVAAITVPALENLLPDKDKIEVLKTYKVIRDINEEIKNDKRVWSDSADNGNWNHITFDNYTERFQASLETSLTCARGARPCRFNTIDGKSWSISNNPVGSQNAIITVDFEPNNNNHCSFGQAACTAPTMFEFSVDSLNLQASGQDALTIEYLANPNKLNDKKADYKKAKNNSKNTKVDNLKLDLGTTKPNSDTQMQATVPPVSTVLH